MCSPIDWKAYEKLWYRSRNDVPPSEREDEDRQTSPHQDRKPQEGDPETVVSGKEMLFVFPKTLE